MLRNKTGLEAKVGDKYFQFVCDQESSVGEIFDALYLMRSHVLEVMKNQQEKDKDSATPEGSDGSS